jgi:hypothetical protein
VIELAVTISTKSSTISSSESTTRTTTVESTKTATIAALKTSFETSITTITAILRAEFRDVSVCGDRRCILGRFVRDDFDSGEEIGGDGTNLVVDRPMKGTSFEGAEECEVIS